ncbi:hypothetical protein EYF80_047408 [Liparis tanakae]|uniref:Uncharacterized protein n=1 Tax=Liparis tanakae TaxID=230148 RepID=A0A4Z2FMQ3_9TELE|nr:hypothetical protein EYF80_047408 [Liparis tanakae]
MLLSVQWEASASPVSFWAPVIGRAQKEHRPAAAAAAAGGEGPTECPDGFTLPYISLLIPIISAAVYSYGLGDAPEGPRCTFHRFLLSDEVKAANRPPGKRLGVDQTTRIYWTPAARI